MCSYRLNSPTLCWNFAGQFLTLDLSGNCCHLLNSHSGIFYECCFKLWYRILFLLFTSSRNLMMISFCYFIEVSMGYMELLELMQSVFLWMSLEHKKALCWTVYQRFYSLMDYSNNKLYVSSLTLNYIAMTTFWFVDDFLVTGRLWWGTPRPQFDICKRIGCSYGVGKIRIRRWAPGVWCCCWWWCRSQHDTW